MQAGSEFAQGPVREVVEDEAPNAHIGLALRQGLEKIPAPPLDGRGQVPGPADQVEACDGCERKRGVDFPAERAFAGSQFENPGRGWVLPSKLAHKPAGVSKE
jgi:hypothetical protein